MIIYFLHTTDMNIYIYILFSICSLIMFHVNIAWQVLVSIIDTHDWWFQTMFSILLKTMVLSWARSLQCVETISVHSFQGW